MNIKKILNKDLVLMDIKATEKSAVIEELANFLCKSNKIKNIEDVTSAIKLREEKMTTGIQAGVAIPHGKCSKLKEIKACVCISKKGIDFNALDKKPSNIFIVTVSPEDRTGPHVQFLAEISKILTNKDCREKILNAEKPEEIIKILVS